MPLVSDGSASGVRAGALKLAFDSGGTFTDVVVLRESGEVLTTKLLSVWTELGDAIAKFLGGDGESRSVTRCIHATTVAANAVLEGTLARTGLITTAGFRDDLEMRSQRRPNIFDVKWDRLPALVPRQLRLEAVERVDADGNTEVPLDLVTARQVVRRLIDLEVEAIAVSLVNSYANPTHEIQIKSLIAEAYPHIRIATSSEVHREIGEHERTSTTVINASLMPILERYLAQLVAQLGPIADGLAIMQSNGGLTNPSTALQRPVYIIESGPAAGVLAAARLAAAAGLEQVLSLDMGGTTAKACYIAKGEPLEKTRGEIGGGLTTTTRLFGGGGHVLRVPSLDIVEVGAGGGSVAWIDSSGLLRIGPQSAGARPGPACYGMGGMDPTVTDANVVLGYINPQRIAGSTVRLSPPAARRAIKERIADPLSIDLNAAAFGIIQVANAMMVRALRAVSIERGRDPRSSSLVAFGGAGPLHAASIADALQIERVYIPRHAGLFSAVGLMLADYRHDEVRSFAIGLDEVEPHSIRDAWAEMHRSALEVMEGQGIPHSRVQLQFLVDMKYAFQLETVPVPCDPERSHGDLREALASYFKLAHEAEFGYVSADPVEIVNLRLRALGASERLRFESLSQAPDPNDLAQASRRTAYFGESALLEVPVIARHQLGSSCAGPVIIEEDDTTVLIPPGWIASIDGLSNVVMRREGN